MVLSRFLSRLVSRSFDAPLRPLRPVYAVGDIHGRADLLDEMLERIDHDAGTRGREDAVLVLLGDYVDRGEASAQVVARIRALVAAHPDTVVALQGNHERMMLEFLHDPGRRSANWLRHGGIQTMASYGVGGVPALSDPDELARSADALARALPQGEAAWLASLPTLWTTGNVACVHAGADPAVPLDDQPAGTLVWGHPDFARVPRTDGTWVVHGHTIVPEAHAAQGRIAVDTGAFYSGRLSAAAIGLDGTLDFLQTG